jgi:uncharacterized protein (DUF3084 family)
MTEVERMILDKLEVLGQEIGETKEEATKAREEAAKAREEATKAREEATKASQEAAKAREEATKATGEVAKAIQEAREAKKIALRTQMLLENEISAKIDVIGEGHDFLKMRLESALQMECKREKMELEILNLSMKVRAIERRLDAM